MSEIYIFQKIKIEKILSKKGVDVYWLFPTDRGKRKSLESAKVKGGKSYEYEKKKRNKSRGNDHCFYCDIAVMLFIFCREELFQVQGGNSC